MSNELIIALISLVGGGVITFLITKYFRERKSLGYQIVSKMSLINVNPEVRDKIKIDYDGKPAENIFSFKVRIINNGNVPIKDQPILFEFDKQAKVLVADYNTKPEKEFGEIKREDTSATNEVKFVVQLLNPKSKKEQIEFDFLTIDNKNDEIKLHAKGENLKVHEVRTSAFAEFGYYLISALLIFFFYGLLRLIVPYSGPFLWAVVAAVIALFTSSLLVRHLGKRKLGDLYNEVEKKQMC